MSLNKYLKIDFINVIWKTFRKFVLYYQRVSEISTLILTSDRSRQE
jgi:hypothetical protein